MYGKLVIRIISLSFFVICVSSYTIIAQQNTPDGSKGALQPRVEKFSETDGVILPWRSLEETCGGSSANPGFADCHVIPADEYINSHSLTIYDSDGVIWYQFSVEPNNPKYYLNASEVRLKPVGPAVFMYPNGVKKYPHLVILRLVRESPHWYEVEINEETGERQFIRKNDRLWARTDWYGVFNMSFNVVFDDSRVKLRDSPDGKVIQECQQSSYSKIMFRKIDGDWMYVQAGAKTGKSCDGWIRWRAGHDILVGSILNGMKVPDLKLESANR